MIVQAMPYPAAGATATWLSTYGIPFSAVSLLAGFEVANDESSNAHTLTYTNAIRDTATPKFGANHYQRAASSGRVTAPDHASFEFGSGAFTLGMWARPVAGDVGVNFSVMAKRLTTGNQRSWAWRYEAGNMQLLLSNTGASDSSKSLGAYTVVADTYVHWMVDFDGTNYRFYADGVMVGKVGTPVTLFDGSDVVAIGNTSGGTSPFDGAIDEVFIIKGYALCGSDAGFTPPTSAYPRS